MMDMDKQQIKAERKTLILSLLAGLCGNATLAVFFSSHVAFFDFPSDRIWYGSVLSIPRVFT